MPILLRIPWIYISIDMNLTFEIYFITRTVVKNESQTKTTARRKTAKPVSDGNSIYIVGFYSSNGSHQKNLALRTPLVVFLLKDRKGKNHR